VSVHPFDPADGAFLADPYPVFARIREQAPVHWHPGLGMHVAVSHAACDAVLRDRSLGRIWVDRQPAQRYAAFNLLHQTSMLESEPPAHTRLRRLVASAFGRGHVERARPRVEAVAERLVDQLAERLDGGEPADLLAMVAEPLPVEVIADLLAVPAADRPLLRPWSNAIVKMYEYGLPQAQRDEAEQAAREFAAYLRELAGQRRRTPLPADLVSDLVASTLSEDEVVGTCALLLMAGHEATVNVVGNGVAALLRRRDQWEAVVADPGLVGSACEEMVRFDSALQLFERTATREVEIFGVAMPAGSKVAALLGAANRDPAVFAVPDRLDVARTPNPHLGFGAGIHFCLGAPLARIEVASVLAALTRRLPGLVLAGEPTRRPEFVLRGLARLEVGVGG
jgi:cytochrome P450